MSEKAIGFSFGRNLTQLHYPVEAAVRSVLPLCERFIFAVGQSDDDTRARVAAIDPKVQIIDTRWPDVQVDGTVLSIEANKALDAAQDAARESQCTWGFYIQADEVIHEDDWPMIQAAMDRWAPHDQVKALLFRYLHFVLDYETTDPWMYHKASRLMRLDGACRIFGDACGPGLPDYQGPKNDGYLDKNHLGHHVQWAGDSHRQARVFHYGWVKTRDQLDDKFAMVDKLWWGTLTEEEKQRRKAHKFGRFIERYPILKKYRRSHPALMADHIAKHPPFAKAPNRWLNPRFYAQVLRHGFHG